MSKKIRLLIKQSGLPYADLVSQINSISYREDTIDDLKETALRYHRNPSNEECASVFALLKEIIFRLTGLQLFDTQLATAIALYKGNVAELPTGEGKTLSAVLVAAVQALSGRSVHVLVFNDYLAKRDYLFTQPIYEFCGLTAGFIQQSTLTQERKILYQSQILYLSAKEAGFDFLRNFLCDTKNDFLCKNFNCAIVDEADSIFIDEAKIPLVIAGNAPEECSSVTDISCAVKELSPHMVKIFKSQNQVYLTDDGISRMEAFLHVNNLYDTENINLLSMVNAALQAQFLLERNKDYLVKDNEIKIIDEFTGRISQNRRYPDILHSAVEAKENLGGRISSLIYHTITMQNFLKQYKNLCGMTGTIQTSAKEIDFMYGLAVKVIPPHRQCLRIDHEDAVYDHRSKKYEAVISEVVRVHAKGQPVLIGTQSVQESETISNSLAELKIPHAVLNAKNDEQEANLVARAGEPFRVTVSTNMAGRGVDIKLGGENEAKKEAVQAAGGLYIIGVGLNRSIRIDNQLRGRAGRQGDAGESRFFISLDESLMVQHGLNQSLAGQGNPIVADRNLKKAVRRVQKYAEGSDAEARYMLEKYAYIQEEQRRVITDIRNGILFDTKPLHILSLKEPELYQKLIGSVGKVGVEKAEKQLALYFINLRWAQYLESMEYVRDGIHLTLIGGKNPIDEYHRVAIEAFSELIADIHQDIITSMKKYSVTSDGIDMQSAGLGGATTTWTYLIDESSSQFSRLPYLINRISDKMNGTVFTFSGLLSKIKKIIKKHLQE